MDKIFEKYPKINVYYKTDDGNSFFSESDAKNHAKSLDNKLVQPIYRGLENTKVKEDKVLENDKNSVDESKKELENTKVKEDKVLENDKNSVDESKKELENTKVKEDKVLENDKNSVDESKKSNVQAKPTNIDKKTK